MFNSQSKNNSSLFTHVRFYHYVWVPSKCHFIAHKWVSSSHFKDFLRNELKKPLEFSWLNCSLYWHKLNITIVMWTLQGEKSLVLIIKMLCNFITLSIESEVFAWLRQLKTSVVIFMPDHDVLQCVLYQRETEVCSKIWIENN